MPLKVPLKVLEGDTIFKTIGPEKRAVVVTKARQSRSAGHRVASTCLVLHRRLCSCAAIIWLHCSIAGYQRQQNESNPLKGGGLSRLGWAQSSGGLSGLDGLSQAEAYRAWLGSVKRRPIRLGWAQSSGGLSGLVGLNQPPSQHCCGAYPGLTRFDQAH